MAKWRNVHTFTRFVPPALIFLLSLMVTSCSEDGDNGTNPPPVNLSASGSVGSTGGVIASADGSLTLSIPPNALGSDTQIAISEVTGVDIPGTTAGLEPLFVLVMEPADIVFAQPAALEIVYTVPADKRPQNLREVPVAISVLTTESLEGSAVRNVLDSTVYISRLPRTITSTVEIEGSFSQFTLAQLERVEVLRPPNNRVAFGMDVVSGAYSQQSFQGEAALETGPAFALVSDITYKSEELVGYSTEMTEGFAFDYDSLPGQDGTVRYNLDADYTAGSAGQVALKLGVKYDLDLDLEVAFPDAETRPLSSGRLSLTHLFDAYNLDIAEYEDPGTEIAPGTYSIGFSLEGMSVTRGIPAYTYDNTLAVSGGNATTLYSLRSDQAAAVVYSGLQSPELQDWGTFSIYNRASASPENTLSQVQFGPTGARMTSWLPEDGTFGWSQLIQFQVAVTDAQPCDNDGGSGEFVYVSSGFGQVHMVLHNEATGFYDTSYSINNFPGAPGNPFTAAGRDNGGLMVVTEGSPGKIYYHDMVDTTAPAVAVGDAGNSPRRLRTLGDLAFVSNFLSNSLTVMTWTLPGNINILGEVAVGDGPVGIDAIELPDGNIGVVSTGFNDNTYTLTIFTPQGSVVSSSTTNLPQEATAPGHVIWLRGGSYKFAVSCNGSGDLVVVDAAPR